MKNSKLLIIAGPCLAESKEIVFETCEKLTNIHRKFKRDFDLVFKSSFRKANRSSVSSFSGVGDISALEWIKAAGKKFGVSTITDVHSVDDVEKANKYVDIIQIPAFLSRQTDLLLEAGHTHKPVNIKKGQFMSPAELLKAAEKVRSTGNEEIWLTERGNFFGYHDLVVDYRNLIELQNSPYKVIYDATHSVQRPSIGEESGGYRQYSEKMAYSAIAAGVDGIFMEVHPDPANAKSDSATQWHLDKSEEIIEKLLKLNSFVRENSY
jgi:2-dehydro-3-deoxyphosphooctonate aldolase (KDO 8-P synthase)